MFSIVAMLRTVSGKSAVLQVIFTAVLLACGFSNPVRAQVNTDAFRDYFLVGQFGEVCTMCEVTVLCEEGVSVPNYAGIPEDSAADFTIYHLQTRTFWSQVSTIWEWFIANFKTDALAARGHTRPVFVYEISDGEWAARRTIEGRLVLEPGVLEFGERDIDRINKAWLDSASGATLGYCQRLPLWDALAVIEAATGSAP